MKYWCISTSPDNWEICRKKSVWGMDARYYVTLKKFLRTGDRAVVYISRKKEFVAVVEFTGKHYFTEKDIGWTKGRAKFLFPYRINFRIIHESRNPPQISFSTKEIENKAKWIKPNFIDDIVFITDKGTTWNQFLQVSIIRITEEDFDTVSRAIMES